MAGEILKQQRENLGLTIPEIADILKIKTDYLVAIENNSFARLPAPVYTVGYIRCYAAYLKIEADSIIDFYTKHLAQPPTSTIIPISYSHKKSPRIVYFISAFIFACLVFYLLYQLLRSSRAVKTTATKSGIVRTERPAALPPVPAAAVAPEEKEHQLSIAALDRTWLLVKMKDRKEEEMLLKPGDVKSWTFSQEVELKIGNAGGIRMNLDGRDLGAPGEKGQVKTLLLPSP